MQQWWHEQLGRRPWWMNALMMFCAYRAFVYVPWDLLFKPVARTLIAARVMEAWTPAEMR